MQTRSIRRAVAASVTIVILSSVAAFADTVPADGDAVTSGNQTFVVLPDATPGQVVTVPISFQLTCTGTTHAAPGATIQLELQSATVPLDGQASATPASIGPVPDSWPAGGEACSSPAPTVPSDSPSTVTLTMPTTPGNGYHYSLLWSRLGATGLTGGSAMTFQVNVVGNTAPTLHLPAGQSVEATSPAGASITWSVSATDIEDAVPPTPTCAPASGSTVPLGETTVHCSVTDGGGLSDSGSFVVNVGDTTAPSLVGMPADRSITTGDHGGATLTYQAPTAIDVADPSPAVGCLPASGSHIAVGTTTVTCTATDASGNHASASFDVVLTYVPPVAWSAIWGEPVATSGSTFTVNPGRTVPVKVDILADGVRQTRGSAVLSITTCGGTSARSIPMTYGGGRWNASLDTSTLGGPGCYTATVSLNGNPAGSFRMDLRGADATSAGGPMGPRRK